VGDFRYVAVDNPVGQAPFLPENAGCLANMACGVEATRPRVRLSAMLFRPDGPPDWLLRNPAYDGKDTEMLIRHTQSRHVTSLPARGAPVRPAVEIGGRS
jgi:hypothetical protein